MDWESTEFAEAHRKYRERGVGARLGFGQGTALIIIDFQRAYTRTWRAASLDPVRNTRRLLDAARERGVPVIFTYVGWDPVNPDAGVWGVKAPTLPQLHEGSEACEIDPLIEPLPSEKVLLKRVPSAFFGNTLAEDLRSAGVDTIVVCGTSTSGCVRATVVDGLSYGFRMMLPSDCVADASPASGKAALFDIDTKYGDVVTVEDVLGGMRPPRPAGSTHEPQAGRQAR
ncbi:isochorismatase family protein [bacterium]|nr:MAG: isochorismatase family protein [bacterium]